ncbi:MAG TPA: cytochrome P450 [Polyangia bacterium]|nr:cytochrome P450 [Polyangia bacterium]
MAVGEVSPGPDPAASRAVVPPIRPPWSDFWTLRRMFGTDVLTGMTYVHRVYGPIVRTRLPLHLYFVADQGCIEEILVKKAESFHKERTSRLLARVIGNGLLVNEGESWRRQRRLIQPAFHHRQLESYAGQMVAAIARAADGWRPGEVRDIHQEMMGVTMNIVAGALFGADLSADASEIGRTISDLMEQFSRMLGLAARFQPPAWVPTPANRRLRESARKVDAVIHGIIEARRRSSAQADDLLSLLIRARDEDGGAMTDTQVRDEAMTLFLAGHETTGLATTYALYLLARDPERQARLADELAGVLGGRLPTLADLERLTYTEAVVLESMRLYPPAWAMGREAMTEIEIGGWRYPRGAEFVISPWVVHRDARTFPDPEAFRPERWADDLARRLPRFAYFPFGGGPRVCIGNRFAMMEAKLVVATAVQRFRFEPVPETTISLMPSATLRPRHGVRLRLAAR